MGPLEKQGVRSITSSCLLARSQPDRHREIPAAPLGTHGPPQWSGRPADGGGGLRRRRARFAGLEDNNILRTM